MNNILLDNTSISYLNEIKKDFLCEKEFSLFIKKLEIAYKEHNDVSLVEKNLKISIEYFYNFSYDPLELDVCILSTFDSINGQSPIIKNYFDNRSVEYAMYLNDFVKKLQSESFDIFSKKKFATKGLTENSIITKLSFVYFIYFFKNLNFYSQFICNQFCELAKLVYIPFSHKIGMQKVKILLEDIYMEVTNNYEYISILKKNTDRLNGIKKIFISDFCESIKKHLSVLDCQVQVSNRTKSIYSIWNKLEKQNMQHEELHDYFGVRVILHSSTQNEQELCYKAYTILKAKYKINEKKTRDWISSPKDSGYMAIHMTIIYNSEVMIEVQLRGMQMHEVAEKGSASHWKYKCKNELEVKVNDKIISNIIKTKKE